MPSESHSLLSSLVSSASFSSLGPISRSVGRLFEAAGVRAKDVPEDTAALMAVCAFSTTLGRLTNRIKRDWAATFWSDVTDDAQLAPDTKTRTEPWTLLKSLLFSLTLVYSSLLAIVTPKLGVAPTPLQLDLAVEAVEVLQRTYFITIRFGNDGFSAWKGVWSGLMDVVNRGSSTDAERLMNALEPARPGKMGLKRLRVSRR